ncbi:MAG: hypothetical protein R2932_18460 [Caldilineaceae bacterium]
MLVLILGWGYVGLAAVSLAMNLRADTLALVLLRRTPLCRSGRDWGLDG